MTNTKTPVTTEIRTLGDYYIGEAVNGAVRIYLHSIGGCDYPADHEHNATVRALMTESEAEAFFDAYVAPKL
jgi:hypothetical protein